MESNGLQELMQLTRQSTTQGVAEIDRIIIEGEADKIVGNQKIAVALHLLRHEVYCHDSSQFVEHCGEKYGYERAYAYRMARAGSVYANLSTIVDRELWPKSISQADVLAALLDDEQCELWQNLIDNGEFARMSAGKLKCYVTERICALLPTDPVVEGVGNADDLTVAAAAEPEPGEYESVVIDHHDPPAEPPLLVEQRPKSVPSPPPDPEQYPPYGMGRSARLKMAALGISFVRLAVKPDGDAYVVQWIEPCMAWQMLLPTGGSVDRFWDNLIESDTVIDCD